MEYRIMVSDSMEAEAVDEYIVESNEPKEKVVIAAALQAISDNDLEGDDIERITFDAMQNRYGIVIQCYDYHISVWCVEKNVRQREIPDKFFKLASTMKNDTALDEENDGGKQEIANLINAIREG